MRSTLALWLLLASTPVSALAQDRQPQAPEARAPLRGPWANVLTPGRADAERLVRQGLLLMLRARQQLGGRVSPLVQAPYSQLDSALVRFTRAQRSMPDDPDLAFYIANALTSWQRPGRDGGTESRVEEAIAAWHRLRELDPEYMPGRVASALASLHFRRSELDRAAAEYELTLDRSLPRATVLMGRTYLPEPMERRLAELYLETEPTSVHANLAEARMLLGELDEAERHYRLAMQTSRVPMWTTLAGWGLALTLHRSNDRNGAVAVATEAIDADPLAAVPQRDRLQRRWGAFAVLHDPDVFFEPAYEVHAYHAVGYEAFAARPDVDTHGALGRALASWRRFLVEGGTASRFAAHARAQVSRLETEIDALPEATGSTRPAAVDLTLPGRRGRRPALWDAGTRVWLPL